MNFYIKVSIGIIILFIIAFIAVWKYDSYQYDKELQQDFDREVKLMVHHVSV